LNGFLSLFEFFHDYLCKRGYSLQKEQYENVRESLNWLQKNIRIDGLGIGKEWFDCTQQGGDTLNSRHKRREILDSILKEYFNKKDPRRAFTQDERKIAWHSSDHRCKNSKCNKLIERFEDFDLDHIIPHDRGGMTNLSNAQILCITCNRSKGKNI
jgi:5-methylcytosine-specific restriction endonuclease McrA